MEREREYFDRLEKKESIELKKLSVMALTVSVVHCKKVSQLVVKYVSPPDVISQISPKFCEVQFREE